MNKPAMLKIKYLSSKMNGLAGSEENQKLFEKLEKRTNYWMLPYHHIIIIYKYTLFIYAYCFIVKFCS